MVGTEEKYNFQKKAEYYKMEKKRLIEKERWLLEKIRLLDQRKNNLTTERTGNKAKEERQSPVVDRKWIEAQISKVQDSKSKALTLIYATRAEIKSVDDLIGVPKERSTDMCKLVLKANDDMISWIMEGYGLRVKRSEFSELGNCLVALMSQPCPCKISVAHIPILSKICAALSYDIRRSLFRVGMKFQPQFTVEVELLAASFIHAANYVQFAGNINEFICHRYEDLLQIGWHFIRALREYQFDDQISNTQRSDGADSPEKRLCVDDEALSRKDACPPSAEIILPFKDPMARPVVKFGKDRSFPIFLMDGKEEMDLNQMKEDLANKLEPVNERSYCGLPFYISLAITRTEAQFMLSEYGCHAKELGKVYNVSTIDGSAEFLVAFLNLLPIFSKFQDILDTPQPEWNVRKTFSGCVITPCVKKAAVSANKFVTRDIYLQKEVIPTHKCTSSWEDMLYVYTTLTKNSCPPSLAFPMAGQKLTDIFTSDAQTFTIHLYPVAFPARVETFLTSFVLLGQCFYDILSALIYLHTHGIVHRDVTGRNILKKICKRGFVLIDFECATRSGEKFSMDTRHERELPVRFTIPGRPDSDRWFPADDIEQLSIFLLPSILRLRNSTDKFSLFKPLFQTAGLSSAYKSLKAINYPAETVQACHEILNVIDVCLKKYKCPF